MKPKHPNPPARPSSPVMKPRMMYLVGYGLHESQKTAKAFCKIAPDILKSSTVLVLDMSPAGQEWLVAEMDAIITRGINRWLAGGGDKACDAVPRAILARLLSAQRLAKGGKGR